VFSNSFQSRWTVEALEARPRLLAMGFTGAKALAWSAIGGCHASACGEKCIALGNARKTRRWGFI